MLSANTVVVPKIRDLRVMALDDWYGFDGTRWY
jgi:hypothetical protein